jgi:hypothetical protein
VAFVTHWLLDQVAIDDHVKRSSDTLWAKVDTGINVLAILEHPNTPSTKFEFHYMPHVPTDFGTASYGDCRKFLDAHDNQLTKHGVQASFCVGDQQSFSRLVWLKRFAPGNFSHIIPVPGEFHGAVHILMAIHKLWWKVLIQWIVDKSEFCVESVEEEWSSVELYNRYRFLYEGIICGIVQYLKNIFPQLRLSELKNTNEYTNNRGI